MNSEYEIKNNNKENDPFSDPILLHKDYINIKEINRGTYGIIFEAIHLNTKKKVAIKRILKHISNNNYIKEINILKELNGSKYIIQLNDVIHQNDETYLIFDYIEYDLELLLNKNKYFINNINIIKYILFQLLQAIKECYNNNILHRDIKPSNILITKEGHLKLIDFGMARKDNNKNIINFEHTNVNNYTNLVITREYRPPELFFGSINYSIEVDMWSIGCIFAEMFLGKPLFNENSDIKQIGKIFQILGTPKMNNWKEAEELPYYMEFLDSEIKSLDKIFPMLSKEGISLMGKLLSVHPNTRIKPDEALQHPFFLSLIDQMPSIQKEVHSILIHFEKENENPIIYDHDVQRIPNYKIKGRNIFL